MSSELVAPNPAFENIVASERINYLPTRSVRPRVTTAVRSKYEEKSEANRSIVLKVADQESVVQWCFIDSPVSRANAPPSHCIQTIFHRLINNS